MKTYFDIGANVGNYTQYLFSIGAEKVICVEPNVELCKTLINKFGKSVEIINKAVSKEKEKIKFYICPECNVVSSADIQWRTNSRFSQPDRTWIETEVDTISIDDLIKEHGIPIHIKLDVEGYEYNAIQSMSKNYCQFRFEWSEEKMEEMILSINYLSKLGYTYFGIIEGDTYNEVATEFMSCEDMISYIKSICIPSRKELWGMIFCLNENDSYVE